MKLSNLKITPKLGILLGVTLLSLCMAGVLAGYLMQREMLNARIEQTRAIVEMAKQGDATREIARNIQQVAAGSNEINANIGSVTSAAAATGSAASNVLANARELDNQSGMLRDAVDQFLAKVRAA